MNNKIDDIVKTFRNELAMHLTPSNESMKAVRFAREALTEILHQELQKAREEEKMGILKIALTMGDCPINNPKADAGWMKFQHDFCLKLTKDNKKSILSETDHSELDQDVSK